MSFEYVDNDHPVLDLPPELAGLMGLAVAPAIVAGMAATAGTFAAWLAKDGWSAGLYNDQMRMMNDVFKRWDALGWEKGLDGKSCWGKNPARRKQWKALWNRFSTHYRMHGSVSGWSYVSDSEEQPARAIMQTLQDVWIPFFEKRCFADTGVAKGGLDPAGQAPQTTGDMGDMLKYGAWILGGIVALNVFSGLRGAFPRKQ